jgi:hypothetical protein
MHIFGVHGTALGALVVLHDDAHSSSWRISKVCFTGHPSLDGSTQQSQWFFGTTDLAIV